jgi:5'-methylthioadenosine phosphorylase
MIARDSLAVIGGSGAHKLLQAHAQTLTRLDPMTTPFGDSAPIYRVRMEDAAFLFLPRHGETGYEIAAPWVNYRANIYALKEHGVTRIMSWSGPGAINPQLRVAEYVLPHDLLDFTHGRDSTFYKYTGLGFLRQHPVFCPQMTAVAGQTLSRLRLPYTDHSVYVCTQGPRLETPEEIRFYRKNAGDLVGMTLAPEAFLARELEMCYSPICYVTNYAEGVKDRDRRPGELFEGLLDVAERESVEESVKRFFSIAILLARLLPEHRDCACNLSMERYRREGRIGEDWHEWVGKA